MASFGHSGSQAPQLIQSVVMYVAMRVGIVLSRRASNLCGRFVATHLPFVNATPALRAGRSGGVACFPRSLGVDPRCVRCGSCSKAPGIAWPCCSCSCSASSSRRGARRSSATAARCRPTARATVRGFCDTSEPGGYCTVLNCTGNNLGSVCPDNAICVLFNPNVPGCPFSARSPSRISESQCRNTCSTNSDCRTDYICALPSAPPWSAENPRPGPVGDGLPPPARVPRRRHQPRQLRLRRLALPGRHPPRLPGGRPHVRRRVPPNRLRDRRRARRRRRA